MVKKIVSLALVLVLCIGIIPVSSQASASYPAVFFFSDENFENLIISDTATVGDVYPIRMKWFAVYNNEGYDISIYNGYGQRVAYASNTWRNSTYIRTITVNWDTTGYEPGSYQVVVTKRFYSLYRWNEAPTTSSLYITLKAKPIPAPKNGDTIKVGSAKYTVKSSSTVEYYRPVSASAQSVTIPDTITYNGKTMKVVSIASKAFYENKKLTSLKIGKNVTTIGKQAFAKCTALKTVTFGSGVRTIDNQAFSGCTSLEKINLPTSVTKIGKQAFSGDKKLKDIVIRTTKLTSSSVGSDAFKYIAAKANIRVPGSKLSAYKQLLLKRGVSSNATFKKN